MVAPEHDLVTANENERPALQRMQGILNEMRGTTVFNRKDRLPKLVYGDEEIEIPLSVFHILRQVVYHMMHGRAISIVPVSRELTTQQAADILNVSRPYLVTLLEEGKIPFTKVGTHRRIKFSELMEYKIRRDRERKQGLAEIAHISEDADLYD